MGVNRDHSWEHRPQKFLEVFWEEHASLGKERKARKLEGKEGGGYICQQLKRRIARCARDTWRGGCDL